MSACEVKKSVQGDYIHSNRSDVMRRDMHLTKETSA